jgi:hypothetical protein
MPCSSWRLSFCCRCPARRSEPRWRVLYVPYVRVCGLLRCLSVFLSVNQSVGRSVLGVSVLIRAMSADVFQVRATILPSHGSLIFLWFVFKITFDPSSPYAPHISHHRYICVFVIVGRHSRNFYRFTRICFIEPVRFNGQMAERSKAPA